MKTISINLPDALYQYLEEHARRKGQEAEDLVLAAVEALATNGPLSASVLALKALDLGKMIQPLCKDDDLLGEMLDGHRH